MKVKKIGEGSKYVFYAVDTDSFSTNDLLQTGLFALKDGKLIDLKTGKEVVISKRGFFHYPKLTGDCGGSVFGISGDLVYTNWHVAQCADKLDMGSDGNYSVDWIMMFKPTIMPSWLLNFLMRLGLAPVSSYDFAIGRVNNKFYYYPYGDEALILTAGNCMSKDETNCINIALEVPRYPPIKFSGEPVKVEVICNYWGYIATEEIIDVGYAVVDYGSGYAILKPAYFLRPIDKSAIPGCSGSAVVKAQ